MPNCVDNLAAFELRNGMPKQIWFKNFLKQSSSNSSCIQKLA